MEIIAQAKNIKISPRKVRVVAEAVKKLSPSLALSQHALMSRRPAGPIAKVLQSAMANATHNAKLPLDSLTIKTIVVEGSTFLKRWRPVSRGRAHAYKKRASHIRIVLTDEKTRAAGIASGDARQGSNIKAQIPNKSAEKKENTKKGEKRGTKS